MRWRARNRDARSDRFRCMSFGGATYFPVSMGAVVIAHSIVAEEVGKWYRRRGSTGSFCVLHDVSLAVGRGEFVSIIGASGCGKTTLLRIIAGLVRAEAGTVTVEGKAVAGDVPAGIGFVFQDPALLAWESLASNVEIGLVGSSFSKAQKRELVQEQLALMGLEGFADFHPYEVSGGMQQRVGLARALVGKPSVLLLDEPLGALDAFTRLKLQDDLGNILASTKCTVVLVTHDVEEALILSDRVVVMGTAPGCIKEVVQIDEPRPRAREEFLTKSSSLELRRHVLSLIMGTSSSAAVS